MGQKLYLCISVNVRRQVGAAHKLCSVKTFMIMKKTFVSLLMILSFLPAIAAGDGYDKLWKKVDEAVKKDLPKTQISLLEQISAKAEAGRDYGQMLKAEWQAMRAWWTISPDSLLPQISRMERRAAAYEQTDPALAAVCYAALGKTCEQAGRRDTDMKSLAATYCDKAMARPAALAAVKAKNYEPFTIAGRDAAIFDGDLLSLIGYTVGAYKEMHDYYATTPNRAATLLTALDMVKDQARESGEARVRKMEGSAYVVSLDSLIGLYGDLPACAEVAIAKYDFMASCADVTAKQKVGFINDAAVRWGAWPRIELLRYALRQLTCTKFFVDIETNAVRPGVPTNVKVNVRNVDKLTLTLTKLAVDGDVKDTPANDKGYERLMAKAVDGTTQTITRAYVGRPDYEEIEDSLVIGGLQPGVYLAEVSSDNKSVPAERSLLYVTDMFFVHQALPGDKLRLAVVSATTGQPIAGARLYVRKSGKQAGVVTCDANGETVIDNSDYYNTYLRAVTDSDSYMPYVSVWNNFGYYDADYDGCSVSIYTDRKIYRPGQTIHVAAVARNINGLKQTAAAGMTFRLSLKDANAKVVAEKGVTTDAYGTASADFTLPQGGLTGMFSVVTESHIGGYASVRVEEYKRPTFKVEFDKVEEQYANGDTLSVTGRAMAYSGVPVQGAKVKYAVRRAKALWWSYGYLGGGYGDGNAVLAEGEAVTDASGEFKIDMPMLLPVWEDDGNGGAQAGVYRPAMFYNIIAEADVTDQAGETRNGELTLPLGSKPTAFSCDMPEKTLRDSLKNVTFTFKNAAGNDIPGDVTYTISGVDGTFTAKDNAKTDITWNTAAQLKSGRHTLTAVCAGDTIRHDFIVFSYDDAKPCVDTPDWFYVSDDEFPRDGSPVYLQFGSSCADVHVLYTVISGEKVLKSGTLELSDEVVTRRLAYKDEYGTGLRINLAWVKDGKAYSHSVGIRKPLPDKRLILKWTTFRDRLTPGQAEEWTLRVTKPDGSPADAQLLAAMYDASLDQIVSQSWAFTSYMAMSLPSGQWRFSNFGWFSCRAVEDVGSPNVRALDFGRLFGDALFSLTMNYSGAVLMSKEELSSVKVRGAMPMKKALKRSVGDGYVDFNAQGSDELGEPIVVSDAAGSSVTGTQVQLRENLNETAFFYPALYTDSTGNISVKFTLPESVTTWRFMGLAHDKDMNNGLIDAKAVASKKVMVQPNMPRFVRVGDRASIAARIINTSGDAVKGTAVMQLVDPETEKVVVEMKKNFVVDADSTGSVSFNYYPDANRPLLVCRIYAEGKDFSDGEQHYLPVLSDAELVTTTVPFTQHGPGVKTIDLKPLFPEGGRNEKLTIEYTNNPAWLMVQTLPYINNVREDNAVSLAAAYYANSVSAYLMKQSPRIKSVFEQWKREAGQESLASSLERNQELKDMLLDETPWVADADRESDQKQLLANYFDEATIANNLSSTLDKLRKLQSAADGSWCWWPGMPYGSPSLTASVVETLVRLDKMTGGDAASKQMVDKAMKYLGGIVVKEVAEMKEREKAGKPVYVIWDNAVRYLYISALSDRKLTADERAAADYIINKVKQNNTGLNLYNKALMAVVLADRGEKQLAGEYVKSLDEYTVTTEELGRYYDSPRAGYSWFDYRIPTQVAAIEAMTLVDAQGYDGEIDSMKRWLLQQKRVQGWDTPINTVNAVYAFLNGNAAVLESRAETVLAVDGKQLELPQASAGLGYVKTSESYDEGGVFTATKTSEGTSWGAVYAQSVQKTSSIAPSSAGISVTREVVTADGKPASAIMTGDRVKVRITIRADRDYDYVQVKDKRAACMEPVSQLSGYRSGYYCAPKDNATCYYFDRLSKGTHVIETEYYADRQGRYETGTCTVQCAYAPEYSARAASLSIEVK